MQKLANWIKSHQITAFYLITFTITWGLGFSYNAVLKREQILLLPLAFVAICGPGIAGIIISAVINTQLKGGKRKSFWSLFLAAWFVTILVVFANWIFIEKTPLSLPVVGVIIIAVMPVAYVIASACSHIPSVRSYLSSLVRLRGVWSWSLAALLLIPALFLISAPVSNLFSKNPIGSNQFPELSLSLIGLVVIKFLYQFFFFNATGEETGWRGFALPRLQARTSPLISALIIGIFWALWHFFFWQTDGKPVLTLEFWIDMGIGHILLSLLIVWMFNRAKGSILVAGIAHAAMNTVQAFAPFGNFLFPVLSVAALVMILVDRMWEKLPSNHQAVYQEPALGD